MYFAQHDISMNPPRLAEIERRLIYTRIPYSRTLSDLAAASQELSLSFL